MAHPFLVIPVLAIVATAAVINRIRLNSGQDTMKPARPTDDSSVVRASDRIARLQRAVDAIAIEVERVGEGQRFLTKVLLAERQTSRRTGE